MNNNKQFHREDKGNNLKNVSGAESILVKFCSGTTAHGFSYLTKSSIIGKIFWILVLIFCFSAICVHLHSVISSYLKYSYTDMSEISEASPVFPHVTVCDVGTETNQTYLTHVVHNSTMDELINLFSLIDNIDVYTEKYGLGEHSFFLRNILQTAETTIANLGSNKSKEIGVDLSDLLVHCTFGKQLCSMDQFHLYHHNKFYNCYTLKLNQNVTSFLTGPEEGLSLILYKKKQKRGATYNKFINIGNTNGLRITIHEPETLPEIVDNGIDVKPGHSTSIGLKMKVYNRLNEPHGRCVSPDAKLQGTIFKYAEKSCKDIKKQMLVSQHCNCTSIRYIHNIHIPDQDERSPMYCLYAHNESNVGTTLKNILCEYAGYVSNTDVSMKDCFWSCEEKVYDQMVTSGQWPLTNSIDSFLHSYVTQGVNQNRKDDYFALMKDFPMAILLAEVLFDANVYELLNIDIEDSSQDKNSFLNIEPTTPSLHHRKQALISRTINKRSVRNKFLSQILSNGVDPQELKQAILGDQTAYDSIVGSEFVNARNDWVYNTFFRVNIYFRDSTVVVQKQVPSITLSDFWSSIGGILGLWAGVSIITVIEVISLIADLIKAIFTYNKIKHTNIIPTN